MTELVQIRYTDLMMAHDYHYTLTSAIIHPLFMS